MQRTLQSLTYLFAILFWSAFAYGAGLIVVNSADYFKSYGRWAPFIVNRGELAQTSLYLLGLRLHVIGGAVCLFAVIPQFWPGIRRRWPKLHRKVGYLYVIAVLLVVSPTGIPMAFLAKGGFLGQAGFLLLGGLTFWTTLLGLTTAMRGKIKAHGEWMIRSYALVASALTFRLLHLGFFYLGVEEVTNYVLSLWLSTLGNLVIAELFIQKRRRESSRSLSRTPATQPAYQG